MAIRFERSVWRPGGRLVAFGFALALDGCVFIANPSPARISPPPAALGAQNVSFQSASGSLIHAWFAPGHAGAGAVLLLHGVGSNRMSMEGRARFLHDQGFTILAPDFEGHG